MCLARRETVVVAAVVLALALMLLITPICLVVVRVWSGCLSMAALNRVTARAAFSAKSCCFPHLCVDFLVSPVFVSRVGFVSYTRSVFSVFFF